ncbi:serine O-acetyltransferase [Gillisia sp. JM1]|uniref:serine O-acetyltransferase n=1 Tax=Gillisia sp. JM1 TaxID=1283286 RepID=UPI0003FE8A96|nr:serine acetyltransferase [Gillisia sp. JM1]
MCHILSGDLKKYKRYSGKSSIYLLITQQGLWAIFVYRINNKIFNSRTPKWLKNIFLGVGLLFHKFIEIITGISLPYSAQIGNDFYIGHFGGIIINSKAIIGNNCNISQGVTIGVSGRGPKRGVPRIGNNVYIGANAVIVGDIFIGDNVVIGANSLVIESVPNNCTMLGVPATKVSDNNSEFYI